MGCIFAGIDLIKKRLEADEKRHTIAFLLMGIICLILTLRIFPFEKLPDLFCMIQFTFRFLEFAGFFLSFVAAVGMVRFFKRFGLGDIFVISFISFLLLLSNAHCIHYGVPEGLEEELWPAVPLTEEMGRVHQGCASFEYLPTKAFQNLEYIIHRPKDVCSVEQGEAQFTLQEKEGTNANFSFVSYSEELSLELPYIYYLGYEVRIKPSRAEKWQKVPSYESEKGFLAVDLSNLTETEYEISVRYTGTLAMKISMQVTLVTITGLAVFYGIRMEKKTKKEGEKIDEPLRIE